MKTIALNILATNGEAALLDRAMKSVWPMAFNEVVIGIPPDAESELRRVANLWASSVVEVKWNDSFCDARNELLFRTASDCVFWMDADDVVKPEYVHGFVAAAKIVSENDYEYYRVPYEVGFDVVSGVVTDVLPRCQFFVNAPQVYWIGDVHERLHGLADSKHFGEFEGVALTHCPVDNKGAASSDRNIRILEKSLRKCRDDRTLFYLGREYFSAAKYDRAIPLLSELIDKKQGCSDQLSVACQMVAMFYTYDLTKDGGAVNPETASIGETYCRIGMSFNVNYAELYVILADILAVRGLCDEAVGLYKKAMSCRYGSGSLPQKKRYYGYIPADRLAVMSMERGNYVEALYWNDVARRHFPDDRTKRNHKMILDALVDDVEAQ